jgi:hypothetical protein
MKRIVLVSGLCLAALLLAPVASAGAERPSADCVFAGKATFLKKNLKALPTSKLGYEFHGTAKCEMLPGREIREGEVSAEGEETLSCAGSLGEGEAKGVLTFGEVKLPFGLQLFGGTPGSTALAATFKDGGVAAGSATFLTSTSEEPAECFALGGAHELHFKGAAAGEM